MLDVTGGAVTRDIENGVVIHVRLGIKVRRMVPPRSGRGGHWKFGGGLGEKSQIIMITLIKVKKCAKFVDWVIRRILWKGERRNGKSKQTLPPNTYNE